MAGVLFGFVACKTESDATVEVEKVEITSTVTSVTVGEKITLTAKVSPDNATDPKVTWTTSTAEVATVDESGVVTGVKAGNATITAKAGDKTATVEITVNAKKTETSTDNNLASDGISSCWLCKNSRGYNHWCRVPKQLHWHIPSWSHCNIKRLFNE